MLVCGASFGASLGASLGASFGAGGGGLGVGWGLEGFLEWSWRGIGLGCGWRDVLQGLSGGMDGLGGVLGCFGLRVGGVLVVFWRVLQGLAGAHGGSQGWSDCPAATSRPATHDARDDKNVSVNFASNAIMTYCFMLRCGLVHCLSLM